MEKINYSKKELKKIDETIEIIIKDMKNLVKSSGLEEFEFSFPFSKEGNKEMQDILGDYYSGTSYYLAINKAHIVLGGLGWNHTIAMNFFGKYVLNREENYLEIEIIFMKEYPQIRELLINKINEESKRKKEEIEHANKRKQQNLEAIDNLRNKFLTPSTIKLDFPPSMNVHEIEIEQKDGRKIGTIDFGGRTIQIITDGDIVLTNKTSTKQKRKWGNFYVWFKI